MKRTYVNGVFCLCIVTVVLAGLSAQADTVAHWKFDENTPGNAVDFTTGAIHDESTAHNGTAVGGDPFNDPDVNVYSRYVDGATGSGDSALRMTLQDWPDESSYVEVEEDAIYVPSSGDFNIDLSSNNVYTIEAVIRAPDPMDIIDSGIYQGTREGFDQFPQWYDYTDNVVIGRGGFSPSSMTNWWALTLYSGGRISFDVKDSSNTLKESHGIRSVTGGLWHQVAVKVFGSTNAANRKLEFYIDGQFDSEASISTLSGILASGKQIYIGTDRDATGERWSDQFVGDIDAIRFSTGTDVTFLTVPEQAVPTMNLGHTGMTDPGTEPHLKLVDASDRFDASATTTATEGTGSDPDSWRIQEVAGPLGGDSGSYAYYRGLLSAEQLEDPTGWTITATMKLVASNKPWNTSIGVEDGQDIWVMSFTDSTFTSDPNNPGADGAGVYKSGKYDYTGGAHVAHFTGLMKMGTTDPADGFHKYQMYYDPATQKVSFYVDDIKVGEQTRADAWDIYDPDRSYKYSSGCRFWFGDAYPVFEKSAYCLDDNASDAYWSDVTMETGKHVKDVVYQPYDVNEDGFVGADDLDVVRAHWGEDNVTEGKAFGDITLDGFVGADDLDQLRAHWGEVCPPIPGLVPEPSTLVLLAIGGLALLIRRRMR